MSETLIQAQPLQAFTQAVFEKVGMKPDEAATEAEVLVWANLRGVDSHGVLRIPTYVKSVQGGGMNPKANYRIEKETPATLLVEADHAFGPVVTKFTMQKAIDKAKQVGVCWAVIRNTTHQGAMGHYTLMAAEQGLAGIIVANNPPNMAPTGARAPGVHNSPFSMAVPGNKYPPLCLDMATSVVAFGKVSVARDKGIDIPLGWALDKNGQPTTDAHAAAIMVPAGGYKGYGMALLFECLSSLMCANPLLSPVLNQSGTIPPGTNNSFLAAIDVSTFTDLDEYKANADATVEGLKKLPRQEGVDEILVPGELENRVFAQRSAEGIPLPDGTVSNLRAVAEELGVPLPEALK